MGTYLERDGSLQLQFQDFWHPQATQQHFFPGKLQGMHEFRILPWSLLKQGAFGHEITARSVLPAQLHWQIHSPANAGSITPQ